MGNPLLSDLGASAPPDCASAVTRSNPAASATPTTEATPMLAQPIASPETNAQILKLRSGLCLNPAWPKHPPHPQELVLAEFTAMLHVELALDRVAISRLLVLWNTLIDLAADEIGDWIIASPCQVFSTSDKPAPLARGVGATVYSDGEVNFHVHLDGLDTPLWLVEKLDLEQLDKSAARHG